MRPWREAWQEALYGPAGFYRNQLPGNHFRTAAHAGAEVIADALARLCAEHRLRRVAEVGAGAGELLTALSSPSGHSDLSLVGVELRSRPANLPEQIEWMAELPTLDATPTLLLGWELLDVVPAAVVEFDGVWREVLVDESGRERLGEPCSDHAWLGRWCPDPQVGDRCEIGSAREAFWLDLIDRVPCGVALLVDYATPSPHRVSTLTGFRDGRQVPPVPDGSCDLTAHVRFDSLAAALAVSGYPSELSLQRDALRALGFGAADPTPDPRTDPQRYLSALARRGEAAELLDPDGLGGFTWLLTRL